MTHEELIAHDGTVWSFAGFAGPYEYEYLGEGSGPVYGRFRWMRTGQVTNGIPVASCFRTERECIEAQLAANERVKKAMANVDANLRARLSEINAEGENA